jgi:hypothetical protein
VKLKLTNNQAYSGLFSVDLPILEGDTPASIQARLVRTERGVKGKHLEFTFIKFGSWSPLIWIKTTNMH